MAAASSLGAYSKPLNVWIRKQSPDSGKDVPVSVLRQPSGTVRVEGLQGPPPEQSASIPPATAASLPGPQSVVGFTRTLLMHTLLW